MLVVVSQNSSNSVRLAESARELGRPRYLVDDVADIVPTWFEGVETVVVTAGASAPEHLVQECLHWLELLFDADVQQRVVRNEDVKFALPQVLREGCATT